jgi:hypothetical protein
LLISSEFVVSLLALGNHFGRKHRRQFFLKSLVVISRWTKQIPGKVIESCAWCFRRERCVAFPGSKVQRRLKLITELCKLDLTVALISAKLRLCLGGYDEKREIGPWISA